MSHIVYCLKLQKEAPGLERAPYPGELGQKILHSISKEAWQLWIAHQTLLINEKRLNLIDPQVRKFLETELQKFLFEGGAEKPAGYIPEKNT